MIFPLLLFTPPLTFRYKRYEIRVNVGVGKFLNIDISVADYSAQHELISEEIVTSYSNFVNTESSYETYRISFLRGLDDQPDLTTINIAGSNGAVCLYLLR